MSKLHKAQTSQGHSKHFFELIRAIGECKSKQEEDRIVTKDIVALRESMQHPNKKEMKELVIRMAYAEMLGHNAEFGYIHAVNLASVSEILQKRTGYLVTWLCVNPEHEFMYLITATIQRDLKSANFLDISAALTAASKLIKPELVPALNPEIVSLMSHSNALVRKKAVLCMHAFYRKSEGAVGDEKVFRQALCDKDPSVMAASLNIFHDLALTHPAQQRELLPSFVSILKQITEHRLSREFDYHRLPAPWIQIRLLKLLGVLAADDSVAADRCAEVLTEVIKRADTGLNIGHAVVCEAINTITSIGNNPSLIELAAEAIGKFLTSNSANLRYLGITALSRIVKIDPKYAQEHQMIVIQCLEDSDDTIRRKTLNLLYAMANDRNCEAIVARLVRFLAEATDMYMRQDLVRNICDIAERLMPSSEWYVETINKVLEVASECVSQATIQGLLKVIAEGDGEDEAEDAQFRTACVEHYFDVIENPDAKLPAPMLQVVVWVIGEYGFLTKRVSRGMLLDRLCDLLERPNDSDTRGWIISALMKLVAHNGSVPPHLLDVVEKLKSSHSVGLQQRSYEFVELAKNLAFMKKVLPLDGCCEDIDVDENLTFLDDLVHDALARGARPYQKKEVQLGAAAQSSGLKTEAYVLTETNVVDENELTAEKFKEENAEKLIIKDSAKRWGAKNLESEAAIEQVVTASVEHQSDSEEPGGAPAAAHADPVADAGPKRSTKQQKLLNDLFGESSGSSRKKTVRRGDRAKEAQRRAVEAEEATRDMISRISTDDVAPVAPVAPPPRPSPEPQQPLTSSTAPVARVEINIQKQLGPDCLRLRVGVMGSDEIQNVVAVFTAPPNGSLELANPSLPDAEIRGLAVRFPRIPAHQPAFVEVQLKATAFPCGGGTAVQVNFASRGGPGTASAGIPLALTDLLRPAQCQTDEFGKQWVAHSGECKVQLKFKQPLTPQLLAQHLGETASLRIIQVIGKECIAGARIVPVGLWLLVHMAVDGNTVNATVRSNSKEFSETIARALNAAL